MVSDQWREMSSEEKERWEEMARQDKARYLKQKEEYAGPWKVPADMKKPKDPTAPKKPTPAYFSFSNERRQVVKKENPSASNGEISKILSKMWKDADDETRSIYIEKEKEERQLYNQAVEKWKQEKKDSGRENWWEHETATTDDEPGRDGGRGSKNKRSRLDILADSAPQHETISVGQNRLDASDQGGLIGSTPIPASALSTMIGLSGPLSMQDLTTLSSQRGLQAIASLLPSLLGQGSQVSDSTSGSHSQTNPFATHLFSPAGNSHNSSSVQILDALQQILTQQQPAARGRATLQSMGEGGSLSLASLFGAGFPSTTTAALSSHSASSSANQSGNQAHLLATLMGAAMSQQQQQQQQQQSSIHHDISALQGANIHALLSILGGGTSSRTPPQQQINSNPFLAQLSLQDLQSLQQLSFLQQGLLQGNSLSSTNFTGHGGSSASSETRPSSGGLSASSPSSSLATLLGLHHLAGNSGRVDQRTSGPTGSSSATPQHPSSSQFHPFISQQQQQQRLDSPSSDQLRESLLQSWLQQQSGVINGGGGSSSNNPATPTMSAAMMEEILARLVRDRNQQ